MPCSFIAFGENKSENFGKGNNLWISVRLKKTWDTVKKNPSFFFFHSFIGRSSCDIQYKFIIQHKKTKEKKKRKGAKTQKGRCNGTNVPCEARPLD